MVSNIRFFGLNSNYPFTFVQTFDLQIFFALAEFIVSIIKCVPQKNWEFAGINHQQCKWNHTYLKEEE